MSALPSQPSDFVSTVKTAIYRRVDHYIELVDPFIEKAHKTPHAGSLPAEEVKLLARFEHYAVDILDRHPPPGPRDRESLVFADLYQARDNQEPDEASPEDRHRVLLIALMAAEVESRGPLRLTHAQNSRLARIFERIGAACGEERLPLHAALAFERAAAIYLVLSENSARDRCLHAKARYTQKATKRGFKKAMLAISWILCGYGYKPYLLLLWVMIELVVFTTLVAFTVHDATLWDRILLSFTNYLDPQGAEKATELGKALLVIESYVSAVSLSVFFALLVHRWFRI
jgi:hypothetical protein